MESSIGRASDEAHPVLRLRPTAPAETEMAEPLRTEGWLDGPLVLDPLALGGEPLDYCQDSAADITREEYRAQWKEKKKILYQQIRELKAEKQPILPEILEAHVMWPPVDMTERDGRSDDDIEFALEKYYVGAQQ
jgi:hypothetical protein